MDRRSPPQSVIDRINGLKRKLSTYDQTILMQMQDSRVSVPKSPPNFGITPILVRQDSNPITPIIIGDLTSSIRKDVARVARAK
jgi:hypothetical protein